MDEEAAHLRARAAELRRLANDIESSPVMSLDRHAGRDTVVGPRFDDLLARLRVAQHGLHVHADELRWCAYRLDQRAGELEASAAREAIRAAGII